MLVRILMLWKFSRHFFAKKNFRENFHLKNTLRRADAKRRPSAFVKGAKKEDLETAMDTYADLTSCPLVNLENCKTIRGEDGRLIQPSEPGGSLSWSQRKLLAPLTFVPGVVVSAALSVYRGIIEKYLFGKHLWRYY